MFYRCRLPLISQSLFQSSPGHGENGSRKSGIFHCFIAALFIVAMFAVAGNANADAKFQKWIRDFYPVAAKNGITGKTYNQVFHSIKKPIPEVLKSARHQPEFTFQVWDYLDQRIRNSVINKGRRLNREHYGWLKKIERRYGVNRYILLAIWSMESAYGEALKQKERLYSVVGALATLAYGDRKRAKFARSQLIAVMKIVQNGHTGSKDLTGSWAGAMGHTQFIPTSYRIWAVDMDGDGKRDIWRSHPDALASAANLLRENGWITGRTWGYEVRIPHNFNVSSYEGKSLIISQWKKLGLSRVMGRSFPRSGDKAVLNLPAGVKGPAFLMLKNFFVLKRYNNADKYALAVGHLADRIRGGAPFARSWPRGYAPLNEAETMQLQKQLSRFGFYDGKIDGKIGEKSKAAILAVEKRFGLEQKGHASKELLSLLQKVPD